MDLQSLAYALTQVVHNFGAVAVLGGAAVGRMAVDAAQYRRMAWVVLAGWALQGASGATFGAISYAYYGRFPDLHGIAIVALLLKMACAATGLLLAAWYLRVNARLGEAAHTRTWSVLVILAATALTAAAFLRWFS